MIQIKTPHNAQELANRFLINQTSQKIHDLSIKLNMLNVRISLATDLPGSSRDPLRQFQNELRDIGKSISSLKEEVKGMPPFVSEKLSSLESKFLKISI